MSKRKQFREMDEIEELEILAERDPIQEALDPFFADGQIAEILHVVKSGKEATVYCCRTGSALDVPYVAAKVYRPRNNRGFKNDSVYQEGRFVGSTRIQRALKKKTATGRDAQFGMWVGHEYSTLTTLYQAGASIPRPIASGDHALLMEYIGEPQDPAPALQHVILDHDEAHDIFQHLMDNIQLWLAHNFIHGDLSAYNILYWQGRVTIIDFPQAVDPRFNSNAFSLLERDIENVCSYVAQFGIKRDATILANRLWYQFRNAQL